MRWIVAPRMRAEIVGFTGVNFSGQRMVVDIWPSGVQGDIDGDRMKSIGIIARVGVRLVLRTSTAETGWEQFAWRAIEVRPGQTFEARDGRRVGVQVPDLDLRDEPDAIRSNPMLSAPYAQVPSPDVRPDWTYGRLGELKSRVRVIAVDRVDPVSRS